MAQDRTPASFAALSEDQWVQAMARLTVLRPHLDDGVPLTRTPAGVPLRTAQRWLARYRRDGLAGLTRAPRRDASRHRLPADLVTLIEGMGLKRPRSSAAAIHRRIMAIAKAQGWRTPSSGTTCAILARLDPDMLTLALEGPAAFRDPGRPWLSAQECGEFLEALLGALRYHQLSNQPDAGRCSG